MGVGGALNKLWRWRNDVRVWMGKVGKWAWLLLGLWRDSFLRGSNSLLRLGSAALLLIMWSCFLALTSLTCLMYLLMSMALGMGAILYLGYTPGLFIVGLFAILILWMFANFWITGLLFVMAGYLFSLNHARVLVLMATLYALYSVQTRIGWIGVFLSFNLSFFSNDLLTWTLQWCDNVRQNQTQTETVARDDFSRFETQRCQKHNSCGRDDGDDKPKAPSAAVKDTPPTRPPPLPPKETALPPPPPPLSTSTGTGTGSGTSTSTTSADEMTRILNTLDHYEALGFPRHKKIDLLFLKKEYRKKAMLVHPDKNMGSPLASESFKRLQCAYEVLSDFTKKRDYDEQLRKEESKARSVCQRSHSSSNQDGSGEYCAEESRRIQCTKCGKSHVWVCTNRSKAKARWCQDCCQYHQAKDGDGWVEHKGSLVFDRPHKVEIPRAFVCAESKVFDVSEWAICQGMACRPNTHRPSFHVNMVGLEKSQRSNSSRFAWDLDAEQEDEEFELWLQQALASGLFCDTSKRRKSWTPFKHTKKQWRRTSC